MLQPAVPAKVPVQAPRAMTAVSFSLLRTARGSDIETLSARAPLLRLLTPRVYLAAGGDRWRGA